MNPIFFLAIGIMALLATGVPALRIARSGSAQRQHLETRLGGLRMAAAAAETQTRRAAGTGPGSGPLAAFGRAAPHALRLTLARADVTLRWSVLLPALGGIVVVCAVIGLLFGALIGAVLFAVILAAAGLLFRRFAASRLAGFIDGLPGFLDATRQLLLVGNSFQQALIKAGANAPPPVQRYLVLLLRRVQNGAPVGDALGWLADRLEVAELQMFAAAVQTNLRHGGRLTGVLSNLIQILRDRGRVERELRASTAETRLSGIVLSLLPVGVAGLIAAINPDYLHFFLATAPGHKLLMVAAGFEIMGVTVMRRIMRLDF